MKRLVLITEIIAPYRIPVFNALARQEGIDLHVIFLAETDSSQRSWHVYKDEIRFSYQVLPSWRRRFRKHYAVLNWGLGAALRQARPDAIVCGGYNYLVSWAALWWAKRRQVPFLLWVESTARDKRSGQAVVEFLKTKFMRSCQAFLVPGKSSFEYLRNYDVPEEIIFTAPNAVDTELFARRAEEARRAASTQRRALHLPARYFLFVGRLVPEKGIFDLLEAYNKVAPQLPEWGLVFVGEGSAEPELRKRAESMVHGSAQIPGFAQRDQLASYYGLADVFVFPTHTDPWGLVVNEAMACGLPVIATSAAGCTADLVQDGWNGWVVTAGDVDQLSNAMQQLSQQGDVRLRMGQNSRERIAGYSPAACATGIAKAALSCRSDHE